jgi:hypothetical protein
MLETFTHARFTAQLGETFRLYSDASVPLEVKLVEATLLDPPRRGRAPTPRAPFSLVFQGPRDVVLPQRIYLLEHDTLGRFELFLVPIGPDADGAGMHYEAVFF